MLINYFPLLRSVSCERYEGYRYNSFNFNILDIVKHDTFIKGEFWQRSFVIIGDSTKFRKKILRIGVE